METSREIINGKSRIIATFEIQWNYPDGVKATTIKIKKLNFGEYNELQRACMKMTMLGNSPKLDLDPVAMNEQSILKSVIEAPWQVNDLNIIRELDKDTAEEVLTKITELNTPSEKKQRD